MSRPAYTAFQRHLLFFATPTTPPRLTLLSTLKASLSLGLNLPIALLLSLSLRILYAPTPNIWSPIIVDAIPRSAHRTQLDGVVLDSAKASYSCGELGGLLEAGAGAGAGAGGKGWVARGIDWGHLVGFWTMAAGARTHRVGRGDVERFQQGEWEKEVVRRRRGRGDVLPFWRGGPIWVGGHSRAVWWLFGVRVYEKGR